MSTSLSLITPSHDTLRRRLELLERRCAELWADEPFAQSGREQAFARLSEIEHRVVALILKRLVEPDDPSLVACSSACEHDLEQLADLWATPRAA